MRNILFVLSIAAIMLFAGCASQPQAQAPSPQQPAPQPPAPVKEPAKNETPPVPPVEEQPPAMEADTCTVEFQKDSSSVYYVMVKTASTKTLEVTCPNGKIAEKQGSLYFCSQLDIPSPAIARLDGKECGRADFSKKSAEVKGTGPISCTVLLAPSRITVGTSSQVTVQAYTPNSNDVLTYNCGGQEITEKISGMVDTGKNCKFDSAGTIQIYAAVNGQVCASKLLEVFEKPKECFVLSSSFEMSKGEYSYTARVAGRGYSGGDILAYNCYGVPHQTRVDSLPSSTDFITTIECRGKAPLSASVPVKIGTDPCGELSLPAGS